jgi:quercetin dioxygenase-like cupin family protein
MKTKLALCVGLMAACGAVWSADAPAVRTEHLLSTQTSWDGKPYAAYPTGQPEATVLRITVPPHATLPWHTHPVINVGYMLAGTLEVENQATGEKKTIRAGDVLPELVGTVHRGQNPADESAVILVFYAGVVGVPVTEKVEKAP